MNLAAAVFAAAAVLMARSGRARLRLGPAPRQERLTRRRSPTRAPVALAVVGCALLVAFGAIVAVTTGVVLMGSMVLRRLAVARGRGGGDDVALTIDLLGAVVACGSMPAVALAAVAKGVADPVGAGLGEAATALALGVDPARVWARVATTLPPLAPAARACARAAASGAGVADELFRLAATARADTQVRRRRRLERAGVWLVLPLGLCFLPAFVLVAVVPVVLSAVPALAH